MHSPRPARPLVFLSLLSLLAMAPGREAHALKFHCIADLIRWKLTYFRANRADPDSIPEDKLADLRDLPKRDLQTEPLARDFLKDHKIYVSVTTSPQRISRLPLVLSTLDLTHVEEVVIALPLAYGRDGSAYEIPPELYTLPKVRILRPEVDWGSATKLIPAADYVKSKGPNGVVVTIDDDIGYPNGMIDDLISFSARQPDSALGISGRRLGYYGIKPRNIFRPAPTAVAGKGESLVAVDLLQGYAGIAYPADRLDTDLLKRWATQCVSCRTADDLIISMALQKLGVPRYQIRSPFYNPSRLLPFPYGMKGDAIHRSSGASTQVSSTVRNHFASHYQKSYDAIADELTEKSVR